MNRLAVVSELASSIAHELNQPLGAIAVSAAAIQMRLRLRSAGSSAQACEQNRSIPPPCTDSCSTMGEPFDRRTCGGVVFRCALPLCGSRRLL
jgi:hypothetical protein